MPSGDWAPLTPQLLPAEPGPRPHPLAPGSVPGYPARPRGRPRPGPTPRRAAGAWRAAFRSRLTLPRKCSRRAHAPSEAHLHRSSRKAGVSHPARSGDLPRPRPRPRPRPPQLPLDLAPPLPRHQRFGLRASAQPDSTARSRAHFRTSAVPRSGVLGSAVHNRAPSRLPAVRRSGVMVSVNQ